MKRKVKVGVLGSAADATSKEIEATARALGKALAPRDVILFTGATTGVIQLVGETARAAGAFHVGISPAENEREHVTRFNLPTGACDAIVYTGFGLKGRNVVLVRSCDLVLIIAGSIGSLNEFTIAYDDAKVIGCLIGTGGTADQIKSLVDHFEKPTNAQLFYHKDPDTLLDQCLAAFGKS